MLRRQFLAAIATIVVSGYAKGYIDPVGYHRHKCNKDGFVWSHKPGGSHICPLCGITQYIQYQGVDPPTPRATGGFIPSKPAVPALFDDGSRIIYKKGWEH